MYKIIFKWIFTPVIKLLFVKKITGSDNIPKKGAFIVCSNHSSYLDHFLLFPYFVKQTNRRIYILAKKEHFDTFFQRMWHTYFGGIPIDRQAGGKKALKHAIDALDNGKMLAIYPEGTRTLDGKLQRGRTGAARLALTARVPVIPVGLIGSFDILPKGKIIPKFKKKIIMNIGNLMYFDKYYGKEDDHDALREVTDKIMEQIAKLSGQKVVK